MTLRELINNEPSTETLLLWIKKIPYATYLGIEASLEKDQLVFTLPADNKLVGNPILPAIHGGVVGAFMEQAASLHLIAKMKNPVFPKLIDVSIDYLRPTRLRKTFAQCQLTRQGQFIGNVSVLAWQDSIDHPCATARAHFLLSEDST